MQDLPLSTYVELFSPTVGEEPLQYLSASLSDSLNLVFFITHATNTLLSSTARRVSTFQRTSHKVMPILTKPSATGRNLTGGGFE